MSRQIFGKTSSDNLVPDEKAAPVERRTPKKPLMGLENIPARQEGQPVGSLGASLNAISERGRHAQEIEKKLAAGQIVVELDTALIDPSFISDRMPISEGALSDLVEAIRDSTQLSPVLVRPHPESPGRYQTAFGHRRIRAVALLGIPVRAIVRDLSDEEMVVAQGQENHARKDLSYIEKALFARSLESRGFSRATIMAALSIYKSDLSNMLAVAHGLPRDLVAAIGPAPNTGRRGWIELAERLKDVKLADTALKAAAAPLIQAHDSDERFRLVLTAVKPAPSKPQSDVLKDNKGNIIGKMAHNGRRLVVTIDQKRALGFVDFLADEMPERWTAFSKRSAS